MKPGPTIEALQAELDHERQQRQITEYEIARLKGEMKEIEAKATAILIALDKHKTMFELVSYIEALAHEGITLGVQYKGQIVAYQYMLGMMLEGAKAEWRNLDATEEVQTLEDFLNDILLN